MGFYFNEPPQIGGIAGWEELRASFRWDLPARFNMAEACCGRWARAEPGRQALTHVSEGGEEISFTYGVLEEQAARLANALAARGLGAGDRIAILLAQAPEVLITHFAAWKIGAVTLPLFTLFGEEALAYRLADSGARMVVTDRANFAKLADIRADLPDLETIWCIDGAPAGALDFHAAIAAASPSFAPVSTGPDDPALLVYTSGTTGPPKGVLHGHRVLLGHLPAIELHHEFFPRPGDSGWTPADWAWIGGLMNLALPCLFHGVELLSHRMRKFDPEAAFALIARHRLRNLFLPPTALRMMQSAPRVPEGLAVRTISSGGESLGAGLRAWARAHMGASVNEIYGQTECNLVISSCNALFDTPEGAMGRAVPGHEVAIIDHEGRALGAGEVGEIAVRLPDPVMMLEYWNRPEATAAKCAGGWLRTGDLGSHDGNGFFTYVSRDDDVITSAGYRIGPSEIENCLTGHEDVVMAAAIGVPDPLRTEVVEAHVVLREGVGGSEALAEALVARVREKVSPHVAPRRIVWAESLPMTATGKIMRRKLRDGAA